MRQQSKLIVFYLLFRMRRVTFDFRAPAAEIESRTIQIQSVPPVEANRADETFQPIRFVFAIGPEPSERG